MTNRSRSRLLPARLAFGALLAALALGACADAPTSVGTPELPAVRASAAQQTNGVLFGPHRFERGTGKPTDEAVAVGGRIGSFRGPYVLHVQNGDDDGRDRVSSARIWLDGILLAGPERFSQQLDSFSVEVQVHSGSILRVENAGAPGAFLVVRIEGTPVSGDVVIGSEGGTAALPDLAMFEFPAGFFDSPRTVSVSDDLDSAAIAAFVEFEGLFRVATRTRSVVRLLASGAEPPAGTFGVTLTVPASVAIPPGHRPEMFVQVYEDIGMSFLDNFQLIPSTYDPVRRTLTAQVSSWAFTNVRRSDGRPEALFMIGTTPGGTLTAPLLSLSGPSLATSPSDCKAGFIGRPLADDIPVTSPYGERVHPTRGSRRMHWGTDYGAPNGTQVVSAADGRVERIRDQGPGKGFGLYMIVRHTDGSATLYAHLQSTGPAVGDPVRRGSEIARSNNSGDTSGPHLHFEYVPNGEIVQSKNRIDPEPCIQDETVSGSITVRDNGSLADDAFAVYLDGIHLGTTAIGASNNFAINNLIPGTHTLTVTGVVVPDNVGTYQIILASGITFAGGGTSRSGTVTAGGSASFQIIVPTSTTQSLGSDPVLLGAEEPEVVPEG